MNKKDLSNVVIASCMGVLASIAVPKLIDVVKAQPTLSVKQAEFAVKKVKSSLDVRVKENILDSRKYELMVRRDGEYFAVNCSYNLGKLTSSHINYLEVPSNGYPEAFPTPVDSRKVEYVCIEANRDYSSMPSQ